MSMEAAQRDDRQLHRGMLLGLLPPPQSRNQERMKDRGQVGLLPPPKNRKGKRTGREGEGGTTPGQEVEL